MSNKNTNKGQWPINNEDEYLTFEQEQRVNAEVEAGERNWANATDEEKATAHEFVKNLPFFGGREQKRSGGQY